MASFTSPTAAVKRGKRRKFRNMRVHPHTGMPAETRSICFRSGLAATENPPPLTTRQAILTIRFWMRISQSSFKRKLATSVQRTGRFTPEGDLVGDSDASSDESQTQRTDSQPERMRRAVTRIRGNPSLNRVYFLNDQIAWAVGDAGHIFHTADSGESWERQLGERLDDARDVLFLNDLQGWIAGDNGQLRETQDGG